MKGLNYALWALVYLAVAIVGYFACGYTLLIIENPTLLNSITSHEALSYLSYFTPQSSYFTKCILCGFIFALALGYYQLTQGVKKNYRRGEEHGSARWATQKEMDEFRDTKDKLNNILLADNSGVYITKDKFNVKTDRNKNILIVGGSGSGKTRYYVKPNLLQTNASYIVSDPKGTLLKETGAFFANKGYDIKIFDLINMKNSMSYNPLSAVRTTNLVDDITDTSIPVDERIGFSEVDIMSFVECLIDNTNGEKGGASGDNKFFEDAEKLLYMAIIGYMFEAYEPKDRNLIKMLELLSYAKASETDENAESDLDKLFRIHKNGYYHANFNQSHEIYLKATKAYLNNEEEDITTSRKTYLRALRAYIPNFVGFYRAQLNTTSAAKIYKELERAADKKEKSPLLYFDSGAERPLGYAIEAIENKMTELQMLINVHEASLEALKGGFKVILSHHKTPSWADYGEKDFGEVKLKRKTMRFEELDKHTQEDVRKAQAESIYRQRATISGCLNPELSKDNSAPDPRIKVWRCKPHPRSFATIKYDAFKTAAGKTLKSIIISCNVRLNPLGVKELRDILLTDEMDLTHLGDGEKVVVNDFGKEIAAPKKSIIYVILSDTDTTFNFLFALFCWQTINGLCNRALEAHGGKLPLPVHLILDEFANIGRIPDIETQIAVLRSRNIFLSIILQDIAQIEARYDKHAKTIIANCDSTLYLGAGDDETNEKFAKRIGQQTISTINSSKNYGGHNKSSSQNEGSHGRDLIQASELAKMPRTRALVMIKGANPYMDTKYRLEKHPNYKFIDPGRKGIDPRCDIVFSKEELEKFKAQRNTQVSVKSSQE